MCFKTGYILLIIEILIRQVICKEWFHVENKFIFYLTYEHCFVKYQLRIRLSISLTRPKNAAIKTITF